MVILGCKKERSSRSFCCFSSCTECHEKPSFTEMEQEAIHENVLISVSSDGNQKKPGGWRAMPFILGNETFERLATFGLLANFTVYLMREFHMSQVSASNVINIWSGITNFAPLFGAFIADAYVGRFRTIAVASFASLLGMLTVTLTAWVPQLHPPKCQSGTGTHCTDPTKAQLAVLLIGLGLLSVGTGGIRPCSIPFGIDQFDPTTDEGRKGINSFFNWYYTTFTVVILITLTLVVYIQDSISWVVGFGIPTLLMASSIVLFFAGKKLYIHVKPEGSIFSGILQVPVAAYRKRTVQLPPEEQGNYIAFFYDPPLKETVLSKLPLTNQLRFLNKAALVMENEVQPDGSSYDKWRLCSIQQVEEVKCLIKIIPIWAAGIISFTAMAQQGTFTVSQALKMDRHLGHKFQIPAGSVVVISMITIGVWLPIYDRIMVPAIRRVTKHEGGITLLQRIGVGIVFSILAMIVAGVVERKRRITALTHPHHQPQGVAPISVMWLSPQLILMGFCEAFNIIGQIEFFNKQFPEHMKSIANSLLFCSIAGANYLSTLVVNTVHKVTGHPDWLTNDINAGRLDYFYYLIAGLGFLNFLYFLYCAKQYKYKGFQVTEKTYPDVELSPINSCEENLEEMMK